MRKSASAPAGPVTAVTEYPRCASSTVATLPTPPGVPDTSTGPAPGSTLRPATLLTTLPATTVQSAQTRPELAPESLWAATASWKCWEGRVKL